MFLAPQPQLNGIKTSISGGVRGVRQTLAVMRSIVGQWRSDPSMRQAATSAIFLTPEKNELSEVETLFRLVRDGIRYTRDIHDVETIQTPDKTLLGKVGDCDDQTVLLATLLEAVGYPTRFVVAGYSDSKELQHVYLQVFANDEWIDADPTEHHPLGWSGPNPSSIFYEVI